MEESFSSSALFSLMAAKLFICTVASFGHILFCSDAKTKKFKFYFTKAKGVVLAFPGTKTFMDPFGWHHKRWRKIARQEVEWEQMETSKV